jgi:hypothetical protein
LSRLLPSLEHNDLIETFILANVLAPYVAWGVGDDLVLSLPYSMLATLLAAVIERPFARFAGIEYRTLLYIMRANILSWMIGLLLAYGSLFGRIEFLLVLTFLLAVPLSITIEGKYLASVQSAYHARLKWMPIIVGNILSGMFLVCIQYAGMELADRLQRSGSLFVQFLREHSTLSSAVLLIGCAAIFLSILLAPVKRPQLADFSTDSPS